ncbi:MAG: hypothetical protein SGCHY_002432 [Lobulomycetales sp.]
MLILFSLVSLVACQLSLVENEPLDHADSALTSSSLLADLDVMKIYSGVAYCKSGLADWSCGPRCDQLSSQTNDVTFIQSPTKSNAAYATYNQGMNTIVVAFKGSSNAMNALQDLASWPTDCEIRRNPDIKVHFGIQAVYLSMRSSLREAFEQITARHQGAKIAITGHSLGGALASLFALEVAENYPNLVESTFLYTYGAPRIGNGLYADQIVQAFGDRVFRVTHRHDIVTQMPTTFMFGNNWQHFSVEYNVDSRFNIRRCRGREDRECSLRDKFLELETMAEVFASLVNPLTRQDVASHSLAGYTQGLMLDCTEEDDSPLEPPGSRDNRTIDGSSVDDSSFVDVNSFVNEGSSVDDSSSAVVMGASVLLSVLICTVL